MSGMNTLKNQPYMAADQPDLGFTVLSAKLHM